jgi:hypothetical protein
MVCRQLSSYSTVDLLHSTMVSRCSTALAASADVIACWLVHACVVLNSCILLVLVVCLPGGGV